MKLPEGSNSSRKLLPLLPPDPSEDSHYGQGNIRHKVSLRETNSAKRVTGWEIHPNLSSLPPSHLPLVLPSPTRSQWQDSPDEAVHKGQPPEAQSKREGVNTSKAQKEYPAQQLVSFDCLVYARHCSNHFIWINSNNASLPKQQIATIPVKIPIGYFTGNERGVFD